MYFCFYIDIIYLSYHSYYLPVLNRLAGGYHRLEKCTRAAIYLPSGINRRRLRRMAYRVQALPGRRGLYRKVRRNGRQGKYGKRQRGLA